MSGAAAWAFEGALHLFVASWQAAAVAVAALAFARLAPRAPASLRGGFLAIAALKFCIPPMLPLPTGIFSRWGVPAVRFGSAAGGRRTLEYLCAAIVLAHFAGWVIRASRLIAEHRRLSALRRGAARITEGPVADLAREACRRAGLARLPDILVSPEAGVPFAFGARRPAICLPDRLADAMSREHLSLVLVHEALHLRRRDPVANVFDATLSAFWWFHPGATHLARARRRVREERCDEAVLGVLPGARAAYSRALVDAAAFASRRRGGVLATAAADGPEDLARRLRTIARHRDARRRRFLPAVALGAAALVLLPGVHPEGGAPPSLHAAVSVRR
jgi:beta-lactamase regulating signal transducer with metallopeptidase domain